jgi:hypothetical protein
MSTEITTAETDSPSIKVFYVPSHWSEKHNTNIVPSVIDQAINRDGKLVGKYCGESLEEMRVRYPTVVLGDLNTVVAEKENMMRTEPFAITEQEFCDALECMPPLDWQHTGSGESFKFVERYCGRMTSIYARIGTGYWSFTDVDNMPHAEIMEKVKAASEKAKAETPQVAG